MMGKLRSLCTGSASSSDSSYQRTTSDELIARSSLTAGGASHGIDESVRIISAEREFLAIAQRDRYGVEAGNIVEPSARRQMNAPAIPPTNTNRLAAHNLCKPNPLADYAGSK